MYKDKNKSFLAFSFSQGFVPPNIPIATFKQGDKELNFILDSGSDRNVIDKGVLSEIQYEKINSEDIHTLTGVNGVVQVEKCKITFQHGEDEYTTEFLVTDLKEAFDTIRAAHSIPLHGMLGSVFFKENKIIMDFDKMVAYNKE